METEENKIETENKKFNFTKWFFTLVILVVLIVAVILVEKQYFSKEKIFTFKPMVQSGILEEAASAKKSTSSDFWLNSGGLVNFNDSEFSTNMEDLDKDSYWRKLYAKNNPKDTDDGYHPQNIFRLVTRSRWKNLSQQVYFKIEDTILSESDNRNASNGVLLFNRYQDGDNLYYTGLRVDGQAVIKKKIDDKYYTLEEKEYFPSNNKYDPKTNPNLIPLNTWIGLKSEVININKDTVEIKLYIDREQKGDWQLVIQTQDKDDKYGKKPFFNEGYAGIRTDFMDVKFRDYSIREVDN